MRLIAFVIVSSLLTSCIGVGHSLFSRGTSAEISIEQVDDPLLDAVWWDLSGNNLVPLASNGTSRFVFDGIKVHLRPHNDQPTVTLVGPLIPVVPIPPHAIGSTTGISYKLERPFVISLSLDPSGEPFTFNTTKSTVMINNDPELPAKEVLGFPCDDPKKFSRLSDRKITSDQKVCLHLLFDVTPPHPSTTFVFLFEGLEKRGSSLRGPRIEFVQGSSWQAGGNVSR